jgi:hypothetical protein
MTAYTWIGGSSANWADPANWTPTGFPNVAGDTATIDAAGTFTVSLAAGETDSISSLTLDAPGATLSVNGTLAFGGANSAAITAGTLAVGSTGAIVGDPDVTVGAGATFDISGGGNQSIGSLSGDGLVLLGTHNLTIGGTGANTTFSGTVQGAALDEGALIQDGTGTLTLDNATMTNNELTIANGNLAVGEGTNQIFYLALGEGAGNSGSATISGGVLNIGGTSPATLKSALQVGDFGGTGLVTQTGGTVNVTGSFNIGNQGGNGTYELENGTLNLLGGLYDAGRNAGSNPAGSGTIDVSGGVFDIQAGSLILGNFYPNSETNGQGSGLMVQTGGTVLVEGSSAIYMASLGNGEYDLDGGTLEVGGTGLANHYQGGSGTGSFHMGGGTLAVTGSNLTTDVNVVLDAGTESTLSLGALNASFSGAITGAGNLDISGTGTASFSTLSGTGTLTIENGTTLSVAGAVGSGETVAFNGAAGTLALNTPSGFAGTITGFGTGDKIALSGIAFDASGTATYDADTHLLTVVENGKTYTEHLAGNYTGDFFNLAGDGHGDTIVTMSSGGGDQGSGTPCYCRGTLILTDRGEIAVEGLRIGDRLITLSGKARPIRWIGRRSYNGRFAAGNRKVLPIRIAQNALADNVPKRDLWVSPLHAVYLDGVLIPACHLVNGTSIVQVGAVDRVEYFHLELETHDVIVADGAPAETFVDDDSRGMFNNAPEYRGLYPYAVRTEPRYCAPRVEEGHELETVRRRINSRSWTDDMGQVA